MKFINAIILGDKGVGKTSLLYSHFYNYFPESNTISSYENMNLLIDEELVNFCVWEPNSEEKHKLLRPILYRKRVDIFILCYSIDDLKSLKNIQNKWIPEISKYCQGVPYILVGTKYDKKYKYKELDERADIVKIIKPNIHLKCSALTKEGVENIFQTITKVVLHKTKKTKIYTTMQQQVDEDNYRAKFTPLDSVTSRRDQHRRNVNIAWAVALQAMGGGGNQQVAWQWSTCKNL